MTKLVNSGDGEDGVEGASDDVATEMGEDTAELLNIDGEAADDGDAADDGILAAFGAEAGVKLVV